MPILADNYTWYDTIRKDALGVDFPVLEFGSGLISGHSRLERLKIE
jgi:hypothetical protein